MKKDGDRMVDYINSFDTCVREYHDKKLVDIWVQNFKRDSRWYLSSYDFIFKYVRQLFGLL